MLGVGGGVEGVGRESALSWKLFETIFVTVVITCRRGSLAKGLLIEVGKDLPIILC